MKDFLFSVIMLIIIVPQINASVYRVNNTGADADYTNVQTAHDDASPGDSLYIESSPNSYGNLVISKKIHLFGTGYRLTENTELQASIASSTMAIISLGNGSSESTIQGLTITHITTVGGHPTISDILISRNSIIGGIYLSSNNSIEDIFILQNEIWGTFSAYNSITTLGTSSKNLIILNNIFRYAQFAYISLNASTSAIFTNNIFTGRTIITTNCDFQNNIHMAGAITNPTLNSFSYNLSVNTAIPSGNNNQQNVLASSIFGGWPSIGSYSEDGRFALQSGSPAEGAGNGGADCGVFGGTNPYILSGIPPIPTIYKFESPNVVTGNFNITISTRSNN